MNPQKTTLIFVKVLRSYQNQIFVYKTLKLVDRSNIYSTCKLDEGGDDSHYYSTWGIVLELDEVYVTYRAL